MNRPCEQPFPPAPGAGSATALKSYAKTLARNATQSIDDRRVRQDVRTMVYRELLPVLTSLDEGQRRLRSRLARVIALSAALNVVLVTGLCAWLFTRLS